MPEELKVYALDEGKNNFQTMTKEQILSAINQKISSGSIANIDDAFITKIKEMNAGALVQLWIGTQAEFEALSEKKEDTLYILSDDPTVNDIESSISSLEQSVSDVGHNNTYLNEMYNRIINGQVSVYRAKYASSNTSKGTIDERLDALGFKVGVITETENFTITDYTLYRRSKIVTLKVKGKLDNKLLERVFISIPKGFRPKDSISFAGKATAQPCDRDDPTTYPDMDEGSWFAVGACDASNVRAKTIQVLFYPSKALQDFILPADRARRDVAYYTLEFEIGWEVADDE